MRKFIVYQIIYKMYLLYKEEKKKYRAKFIKDFALAAKGGAFTDNVDQALFELAISKCMDAAIQYKDKLDLEVIEEYNL